MNGRTYITYIALLVIILISVISCRKQATPDTGLTFNSFYPKIARSSDPVKIIGINFTGATGVSFGGIPAQSFNVISDSVIFAFVDKGASGNITVSTPAGNMVMAGFTYYTPKTFNMAGPCTYSYSGPPYYVATTLIYPGSINAIDGGSISILELNKFDTHTNFFSSFLDPWSPSIPTNPYADSSNYVRLYGFSDDFGGYARAPIGGYLSIGGVYLVYAKLVDTSILIPLQGGLGFRLNKNIQGTGSLANGKLRLNYTSGVVGVNIKTSNVISQ